MLTRVFLVLTFFALNQFVVAGPGEPPKGPPGAEGEAPKKPKKKGKKPTDPAQPEEDRALKAMKIIVQDAIFEEMTFEDFGEWLGRTTKANVVVRWKIIEKAGVPRHAPITMKESGLTIKKLLELVFRQLTEDGKTTELAAKAEGNTILISTRADFNSRMIARVYEVEELLLVVPDFAGRPIGASGGGSGPSTGMSRRGARKKAESEKTEQEQVDELIACITQSIEPASWKVNGGKGTIVFFKGRLVIRNNAEVHQVLAEMLGHPGGRKQ